MNPNADLIDLSSGDEDLPGSLAVRLACTKCHGGNDEAPGGALTKPVRRRDDPKTVVRCAECGKKHGRDSLTVV